ncbi:MAG: hypothetical protein ACRD0J_11790 [Acidimicrobiales bacterium]
MVLRSRRWLRSTRANAAATSAACVLALVGLALAYPPPNPLPLRAAGAAICAGMAFVALRCARAGILLTPRGVVVRNIVDTTKVPWDEVRGVDGLEAAGFLGWGRCVAVRTVSGSDVIAHRLISFSPARLDRMLSDIRAWPVPAAGAAQPARAEPEPEPEPGGGSRS